MGNLIASNFRPQPHVSLDSRIASSVDDLLAIQDLRRIAFYPDIDLELEDDFPHRRYEESRFDDHCDHLLVSDQSNGKLVATCRLQPGLRTLDGLDFSAAQEFDLEPLERFRNTTTEFSLVCTHPAYDSSDLMTGLFQGMIDYAEQHKTRYLLGCVSLDCKDHSTGAAIFGGLNRSQMASTEWQTNPWSAWACPLSSLARGTWDYPRLLQHHLALGAKICAPPSIDRRFNTISFLVVHDLGIKLT